MDLRNLIDSLRCSYDAGEMNIPNIEKIIDKLVEMEAMIEMEDVKKSFVSQLILILLMRRRNCVPPFQKMHTVFSGPPGVGKTSMSILVAQIWALLGIVDKSYPSMKKSTPLIEDVDRIKFEDCLTKPHKSQPLDSEMKIKYKRDIAHIMTEIGDKIQDIMITLDVKYGDCEDEDEVPDFVKDIYSKSKDSFDLCTRVVDKYAKYFDDLDEYDETQSSSEDNTVEELPYVVLGRGDFVGSHVGETSIKTEELLEKHKGKVIILEEAYLFFNNERDSFGMEALTLINRYMDEHSDDYIFIFNGYEEKLNRTIFKAQPGLKRRIQWTFNIDRYTPDGLYKIFRHQLARFKQPRWTIKPADERYLRKFFETNREYFPYFGGDTERLILKCQLSYGEQSFGLKDPTDLSVPCILSKAIIDNAFARYKQVTKIEKEDLPPAMMYM